MAKTKEEKLTALNEVNEVKETKEVKQTAKSGPTYDELMEMVKGLAAEVASLKSQQSAPSEKTDRTDEILNILAHRASDREVVIVHNCEMNGGLTTHLALSNMSIDFHSVGEERVLSWPQFEECISKYRSFFDRKIILVSSKYSEIAERFGLPITKDGESHVLTRQDIVKLPKMSVNELDKFVNSLDEAGKETIFSYWLGKCYTKEPGFYDRYKMETLNRLSGKKSVFGNILLVMNGETTDEAK